MDVYEEQEGVFFHEESLEVMTEETLARLLTFSRVLLTFHQAYFTLDVIEEIVATSVRNVDDYLAGRITECTLVPKSP